MPAVVLGASFAFASLPLAQEPVLPEVIVTPDDARAHGLESLRTIVETEGVPKPSNLDDYIRNQRVVHQLGKALFFEMGVGSDGIQACATCHFHAGADNRTRNQINPDLNRVLDQRNGDVEGYNGAPGDGDVTFQTRGPNQTVDASDYPLVRNIGNGANVIHDGDSVLPAPGNSNDVTSSQGVRLTDFVRVVPGSLVDEGIPQFDPVFNANGRTVRRVEPRNTPTVINAVFNFANFWDGRANPCFNGVDPFGKQSCDAKIFVDDGGGIVQESASIDNASLASQAVGPPGSPFEMSWGGRPFRDVGRKVLSLQPLSIQDVDPNDSLLRNLRHPSGKGLWTSYEQMIRAGFHQRYWRSRQLIHFTGPSTFEVIAPNQVTDPENTYTLMEVNFSLFFGLAVQAFESLLIADLTPFDQWMRFGGNVPGFGADELAGLNLFVGKGSCFNCHGGPELTNASVRNAQGGNNVIEPMLHGDGRATIYDNGFYNISITPTVEDLGRGGQDPCGRPLGWSRQHLFEALGVQDIPFQIIGSPIPNLVMDPDDSDVLGFFEEEPIDPENPRFFPICRDLDGDGLCSTDDEALIYRNSVDGHFKTPGLRNSSLTGPYGHNGGFATLMEVVEFYDRGGNFCRENKEDLDPDIQAIGFTTAEKVQLVAFLVSLTDQRVAKRSGIFDGPQLLVPHGHNPDGSTILIDVPATGRTGLPPGQELQPFLGLSPFSANVVIGETDDTGDVRCSPNFEGEAAE